MFPPRLFPARFFPPRFFPRHAAPAVTVLDLREAIIAMVSGDSTLTGLVGRRIFPGHLPMNQPFPQVTFHLVSRPRLLGLDGPIGLAKSRVTFSAYSRGGDPGEAAAIADALRRRFDGFKGTVGGLIITGCYVDDEVDDYVQPEDGGADDGIFHDALDIFIHHWQRTR